MGEEDGVARTPEWACEISDVPAKTIERIALEFAKSKKVSKRQQLCKKGPDVKTCQKYSGCYNLQKKMQL